jgi:hypothetical protein
MPVNIPEAVAARVEAHLRTVGEARGQELRHVTGLLDWQARQLLDAMTHAGWITRRGIRAGVRYRLPGAPVQRKTLQTQAERSEDASEIVCPLCAGRNETCHGCAGLRVVPLKAWSWLIWPLVDCPEKCETCRRLKQTPGFRAQQREDSNEETDVRRSSTHPDGHAGDRAVGAAAGGQRLRQAG